MPIELSVITPVLNGENFIDACIENVAAQGCGDRIEHIVMDGRSTDRTMAIAEAKRAEHSHLVAVSQADSGQSDAMNRAIRMARGGIIGILNVDDSYEPGALSRALEIMSTMPGPTLIVGNCAVRDAGNQLLYINKPTRLRLEDLVAGWHWAPHPVNPSAYFYHKTLHDRIGWYDVDDHYAHALDFLLNAVTVCNVAYFDETWGNFSYREGTKTFEDIQAGEIDARKNTIFARHIKKLSLPKRLWVYWKRTNIRRKGRKIFFRPLKRLARSIRKFLRKTSTNASIF